MNDDWSSRKLHFVGIGGAGMSGLALVAQALGAEVTGSDRADSPYAERLREHGIEPTIGHAAGNVPPGAEVVYSSAVPPENPERQAASGRELHRADLLGEITRLRRCIAITGTHGKTTTTAMVVHALRGCGLDPSYVVGAELGDTGVNAAWGSGEWVVVEADESDRSLLKLDPDIAMLTNAELDHHATYRSILDLEATLAEFMHGAAATVVWDRPALRALCPPGAVVYDAPAPLLGPGGVEFRWRGIDVFLGVPGAHNAVNAAGALEACVLAGAEPAAAAATLASFRGARRRFERVGETASGAAVYDDYAHHPTEVAAMVALARALAPARVVAVFQPHLYSRTRAMARSFGAALAGADVAVVLGIYPARERAEDFAGVSGQMVAAAAADAGGRERAGEGEFTDAHSITGSVAGKDAGRRPHVAWIPNFAEAEHFLRSILRAGDLCLVMGAGNVDSLARALVS